MRLGWRGVLGVTVVIVGVVGLLMSVRCGSSKPRPEHKAVARELALGDFQAVPGSDVFRADLQDRAGSYSTYGRVRNTLFIEPAGTAKWLLTDDDHIVQEHPVRPAQTSPLADPPPAVAGVALALPVQGDATQGKMFLFDPTGRRIIEAATAVRDVHGVTLTPQGRIVVLYEKADTYVLVQFDASSFTKLQETVVSVPPLN